MIEQGEDRFAVALARGYGYEVLGGLFGEGITERWLPFLEQMPALFSLLPSPFQPDQAAADHQTLFGFDLFPYESLFLQPDGLLGGEIAAQLRHIYEQAGAEFCQGEPDHLANELNWLAVLCRHEAESWQNNQPHLVHLSRHHQQTFLQQHLLRWLPALAAAIHQTNHPFYCQLTSLLVELVMDHLADLQQSQLPLATRVAFALPPIPTPLLQDKTSLKDIATYLSRPAYSGLFMTRSEMIQLAQHYRLPQSFGSRAEMLSDLLLSAGQYGEMPAVLQAIQTIISRWQTHFTTWQETYSWSGEYLGIWQERLHQTSHLLDQLTHLIPTNDSVFDLAHLPPDLLARMTNSISK